MARKRPPEPPDDRDTPKVPDTPETPAPSDNPELPNTPPLRIIVKRGALKRFDTLTRKAQGLPVVIEWDRRVHSRRESADPVSRDRRKSDRRQSPPFTWQLADFVITGAGLEIAGEGSAASAQPDWPTLEHAHGRADDLPALLAAAAADRRPARDAQSAWFALWRALYQDGRVYTASVASVPYLLRMAPAQVALEQYDALLLAATIELARLEGRAPGIPATLQADYAAALEMGRVLTEQLLSGVDDGEADSALTGSAAAFRGDAAAARALLEPEIPDGHSVDGP
jgi:hypothetical protein